MPIDQTSSAEKEISALALLSDTSIIELEPSSRCRLLQASLQDGIELLLWQGRFESPVTMNVRDDSNRIHFSYSLRGRFQSWFDDGGPGQIHTVEEGGGCINYNPGRRGKFHQRGEFESVTVMVRPDILLPRADDLDDALKRSFEAGRCFVHYPRGNAELHATAQSLSKALHIADLCPEDASNRQPLWFLGHSLALVSLLLEAHDIDAQCACSFSVSDRRKLLRAKDLLLENLSRAPTASELAGASGLSVIKLKRGFRQLFNHSVYGLFQRERMHEARRRLCVEDQSVMTVAAELGYTNASHFAAAFFKEFGVNPSTLKRR